MVDFSKEGPRVDGNTPGAQTARVIWLLEKQNGLLVQILEALKVAPARPNQAAPPLPSTGDAAPDSELLGEYGDPIQKTDPKRWTGQSFAGFHFSECSPEYLECVASFKDWQAGKDDETGAKDSKGRPKSHWARKDARLARGWARRLRELGAAAMPAPANGGGSGGGFAASPDDDIPFVTSEPNPLGL